MSEIDKYKKISWIHEMPEIFKNEVVYQKRLDSLSESDQKKLIYQIIESLYKYFGKIPANIQNESFSENEKLMENLGYVMEIWLSGLCDLTVAQIIEGLLDILNLKTEYQTYPPKSVMEFYAVCKKNKPPYHDLYNEKSFNGSKLLGFNFKKNQELSEKIALKNLIKIYQSLGKDYIKNLESKINKFENKYEKRKIDEKEFESRKNMLTLNNQLEA